MRRILPLVGFSVGILGISGCEALQRISPESLEAAAPIVEAAGAAFGPPGWIGGGIGAAALLAIARIWRGSRNRTPTPGAPA